MLSTSKSLSSPESTTCLALLFLGGGFSSSEDSTNFFFTAVGFFEAGLLLDTLPLDESSLSCGGPSFLGAAFFTTFLVISSSELDTSMLPPKPPALESSSESSLSAPDPLYSPM